MGSIIEKLDLALSDFPSLYIREAAEPGLLLLILIFTPLLHLDAVFLRADTLKELLVESHRKV